MDLSSSSATSNNKSCKQDCFSQLPKLYKCPTHEPPRPSHAASSSSAAVNKSMQLNAAYQALEDMRKLNLQLSCQEIGVVVDHEMCTICLLSCTQHPHKKSRRRAQSCLLCGAPTCKQHTSSLFDADMVVCTSCEGLFTTDFQTSCLDAENYSSQQLVARMIDVYDRTLLLLHYSAQFIPQLTDQLQQQTVNLNKIAVTSSSAGLVSGALGVAAAATLMTPAGTPLLIASLLLGGSATLVQTSADVYVSFLSQPHVLFKRIVALDAVAKSILAVSDALRDLLLRDNARTCHYMRVQSQRRLSVSYLKETIDNVQQEQRSTKVRVEKKLLKHHTGLFAGLTVGRYSLAGVELATVGASGMMAIGRGARIFSKTAGGGLMRTFRAARIASGALAGAALIVEAAALTTALRDMRRKSPCERARLLNEVLNGIILYPSAASLEADCVSYLDVLALRRRVMREGEVSEILLEQSQEQLEEASLFSFADAPFHDSCSSLDDNVRDDSCSSWDERSFSSFDERLNLLARIEKHKARESSSTMSTASVSSTSSSKSSTSASSSSSNLTDEQLALLERIETFKEFEMAVLSS